MWSDKHTKYYILWNQAPICISSFLQDELIQKVSSVSLLRPHKAACCEVSGIQIPVGVEPKLLSWTPAVCNLHRAAVCKGLYSCQSSWCLSPPHTQDYRAGLKITVSHRWRAGDRLSIRQTEKSQTWKAFCQVIKLVIACLTRTKTLYITNLLFSIVCYKKVMWYLQFFSFHCFD